MYKDFCPYCVSCNRDIKERLLSNVKLLQRHLRQDINAADGAVWLIISFSYFHNP